MAFDECFGHHSESMNFSLEECFGFRFGRYGLWFIAWGDSFFSLSMQFVRFSFEDGFDFHYHVSFFGLLFRGVLRFSYA